MGYVNGTSILEREIINALEINSNTDWDSAEITPNQEFKELIKFVKKLFREEY
jgi:hypothetical protein